MGSKFANPVRLLPILNSSVSSFSSMATVYLRSTHFSPYALPPPWAMPPPSLIWMAVMTSSLVSPLPLLLIYLRFIPHTATSIMFKKYKSDRAIPLLNTFRAFMWL